jgi:hypothetical protein
MCFLGLGVILSESAFNSVVKFADFSHQFSVAPHRCQTDSLTTGDFHAVSMKDVSRITRHPHLAEETHRCVLLRYSKPGRAIGESMANLGVTAQRFSDLHNVS